MQEYVLSWDFRAQYGYKSTAWESVCLNEPNFLLTRHKATGYTVQCGTSFFVLFGCILLDDDTLDW